MFIRINSVAPFGMECRAVAVEVDIAGSWPGFQIVGLADTAIQEAKERIRTAWKNSGLNFPANSRIIINLAPADLRKEGALYDLPIALGMFLATQQSENILLTDSLFVGELALDGTLRHTSGILPIALFAESRGYKKIYVPKIDAPEAALVQNIQVFGVSSFREILDHITGGALIEATPTVNLNKILSNGVRHTTDMSEIKGQEFVKRALEIAASGSHNILLSGPPGSGKTLIARTLPSILPPLSVAEALEVTQIYSVSGLLPFNTPLLTERQFRSPHHGASSPALVGGGTTPRPGEITLAHRGVLFLDEFPEFSRIVLETLRQPLEDGVVTISRAQGSITFPARFMLVASQNPCPCGYATDTQNRCTCSPNDKARYAKKISGPLLDRIDIQIEVPRVQIDKLAGDDPSESSEKIRQRVMDARKKQQVRFAGRKIFSNSEMGNNEIKEFCQIDADSAKILRLAMERMHFSARSYHRILKVARSIADLAGEDNILVSHIAEALQLKMGEV